MHPLEPPPVDSEPRPPNLDRLTHCTCPTLGCGGRASRDWASCSPTCRHCNPAKRRRRALDVQLDQDP